MMLDWRWFNKSAPWLKVGPTRVRAWNVFNRCAAEGHWWGVGLLQIGRRHLAYIGHSGAMLLFVGRRPS